MDISKRLLSICSLIPYNSLVYDIGCDHGLLDIYLTLYKNCHCIAYDVNKNIIARATHNIKKYNLNNKIDTIVGSGFDELNLNEKGIMVLAGMGTATILKILSKNKTKKIICQTNTDQYTLRKSICEYGYYIKEEKIIFENGRYYITILFYRGKQNYCYDEYLLGPILLKEKNNIFKNYLTQLYKKNIKTYNKSINFQTNDYLIYTLDTIKKYM